MREYIKLIEDFDTVDKIVLDVPLFLRLLEYAREDAQTDMDLHKVAERILDINREVAVLGMDNYDAIVGGSDQD